MHCFRCLKKNCAGTTKQYAFFLIDLIIKTVVCTLKETTVFMKAPEGIRTPDLRITNASLYQLSHGSPPFFNGYLCYYIKFHFILQPLFSFYFFFRTFLIFVGIFVNQCVQLFKGLLNTPDLVNDPFFYRLCANKNRTHIFCHQTRFHH